MSPAANVVERTLVDRNGPDLLRLANRPGAESGEVVRDSRPLSQREIEHQLILHEVHGGNCPICKGAGPVDVHRAHVAWSIFLVPFWSSLTQVCCRSCAIKLQLGGIAFSVLFGLWGIPFCWIIPPLIHSREVGFVGGELWGLLLGLTITPLGLLRSLDRINFGLQVLRNLRGMIFGPNPRRPSVALDHMVRSRAIAPKSPRSRGTPRAHGRPGSTALESRRTPVPTGRNASVPLARGYDDTSSQSCRMLNAEDRAGRWPGLIAESLAENHSQKGSRR